MNKEFLIQDIQALEDQIIAAQDERDRLKAILHEAECDEENERLEALKNEPLRSLKEWNEGELSEFHARMEYLSDIAKIHDIKHCIYSVYEHDLDEIAVPGKVLICHEGWDDEEYTEAMENPTWLDIWKFADVAMYKVDDAHHAFLEGLYKGKFENIYHLSMGS